MYVLYVLHYFVIHTYISDGYNLNLDILSFDITVFDKKMYAVPPLVRDFLAEPV
jgi:hypothetical protein